ncbi:MAG: pyridoxine 5'-phosphate synthase [Candidatus Omnitrophica bacterium]|nr:pyridoxine 5'-phosphate synthase [Candidatus Omnitrophota bacterium]
MRKKIQLGVNIDHVATLRQARGGVNPEPLHAAREAEKGGADGITVHLREDRRHIQDHDIYALKKSCRVPLNLEMALSPEIVRIALRLRPQKVCFVPEKRKELTTEGGLDAYAKRILLKKLVPKFRKKGIEVSLFIDPLWQQIRTAAWVGAPAIEIHTGAYANAQGAKQKKELNRLRAAAKEAHKLGLKVHAGHGLDYENVKSVARIPEIVELNIGHSIISQAMQVGVRQAVKQMKRLMRR